MQLFYSTEVIGNEIILDEFESKHAIRVLRLSKGDEVFVVDGRGGYYRAEISVANVKSCRLSIRQHVRDYEKRGYRLHIGIAPPKSIDRFEWFLEKATEIGVDEITPLLCDHSERKNLKPERLQKILISAMKQSLKAYLPVLHPMVSFNQFISCCIADNRFIAHCYAGKKPHLKEKTMKGCNNVILIGPEGDFSEKEVDQAKKQGFGEVALGKSRLRTETAGIVACNIVNLGNDE
ncbi:MAG: 16S rRNA (uracil(1498)-N(3))-methyltransferase [Draconibacterium sp.]|nr:MAG: 16S rRNA (uracil(1498)-N(3))-methyltransferase [Draconibacterium sp.]